MQSNTPKSISWTPAPLPFGEREEQAAIGVAIAARRQRPFGDVDAANPERARQQSDIFPIADADFQERSLREAIQMTENLPSCSGQSAERLEEQLLPGPKLSPAIAVVEGSSNTVFAGQFPLSD